MTQLSEIDSLFTKSWNAYKPHIGYYALLTLTLSFTMFVVFAIVVITLILIAAQPGTHIIQWLFNLYNNTELTVPAIWDFIQIGIVFILLLLTAWILGAWNNAATWLAITHDAKIGIGAVMSKAIPLTPRYVGVNLLRGIIIMAGYIFFIFPGILFSGWFTFAQIAAQKHTAFDALKTSRSLVIGRWWAIIGRLILGGIIASVAPQIVASLSSASMDTTSTSVMGPIIIALITVAVLIAQTFFLMPWYMIFKNELYQDAHGEPQL